MQFEHDYDFYESSESIIDILNRQHHTCQSAENSLSLLRKTLLANPCPAEVKSKRK